MEEAAAEEEVQAELEAVLAVYGEDCRVLQDFPPHINVSIRPRTADDPVKQFVEAVLSVRAGAQVLQFQPMIMLCGLRRRILVSVVYLSPVVRRLTPFEQ